MTKTATTSNLRIRPIEPRDFAFIQSLASRLPAFTVPSNYILWFFSRFHPDYCRVLERSSTETVAYLLAMPTSTPSMGIAIWQIAAVESAHALVLEHFAAYLRDLVEATGSTSLFFTTQPSSTQLRLIQVLAGQFGSCEVSKRDSVPAGQGEYEFSLFIGSQTKKGGNRL